MRFKPAKSRSMVLKKGRVKKETFKIGEVIIPSVTEKEKPVKCLGKWFNDSLKDGHIVAEMCSQAEAWMKSVDGCGLPGKFKSRIYEHVVPPRVLWHLLVYDVPMITMEAMERMVNEFLRRRLGVPRSFKSIGLYCSGAKLQLPFKSPDGRIQSDQGATGSLTS